jgi:uncharacterized protein YcnI
LVRRIAIVLGTAAIVVFVMALPAAAHVSIQPDTATKGGFATLAFQVPNEKEDAKTVQVEVKFPDDHPIGEASAEPVPGWTTTVKTKKLSQPVKTDEGDVTEGIDTITWKADSGQGLGAGEFQQFLVSMGLPDDADTLQFPTIQTYDNGDIVSWIQQTPAGGSEPENPVPELKLVAGESDGGTTATTAPPANGGTAAPASNVKKSDVDSAKTLAIVALIVGIVGLLAGVGGFAMGRRRPT